MSRSAIAYLSTENLLHNLNVIKKTAPKSQVIAMVKANAYGHGIRSVGLRLKDDVDLFGVASIDEALILRKVGVTTPIILMEGVFEQQELYEASQNNFHVVFHSPHQIEWLNTIKLKTPLFSWLKVNTGLGRLGIPFDKTEEYYSILSRSQNIFNPLRIMSHFSCSDVKDHRLNQHQILNFNKIVNSISTEYSFCNSGGIFSFPTEHHHFIRPGISLYGISPFSNISAKELNLKPVMTLKSSLIAIQNMQKGDAIGYGATYICEENMPVGVVAFGYGDGYPITAKSGTPLLINNTLCPIIGRVSMDMMMVDLRESQNPKIGDPVILWGENLPVEDVVKHTQDITWNMLTSIQHRVKFIWDAF
jgi:alanine racemase